MKTTTPQVYGHQAQPRVTHGGSRATLVEFEVRALDRYGDAQDVTHWATLAEARAYVLTLRCEAWVVEKHTSRSPAFLYAEADTYVKLASGGSRSALLEEGWL